MNQPTPYLLLSSIYAMRDALYLTGSRPTETGIERNAIEVHHDHLAVKSMVQGHALCAMLSLHEGGKIYGKAKGIT